MKDTIDQLIDQANNLDNINDHYAFMGSYFGYPECCIKFFINHKKPSLWFQDLPWYATRPLKLRGYVPCEKCANLPRQVLVADINSRRKFDKIK